ncbi:MAG: DUF5020 domain-containing protein, partial [Alphaproteobacteria bacterium]|nr:DUF5020 domain-containing protein [Alphaproteobacteria bacterium]
MVNYRKTLLCLGMVLGVMGIHQPAAQADDFIEWHSTNVQILRGHGYVLGSDNDRIIMTLEHANRWKYGDFFAWVDMTWFDNGGDDAYAEFTPRLSLGKVTGEDLSFWIFKDFYLAAQLEKGEKGLERYMTGVGTDLDLPGFKFFKANLFNRNNPDREDHTWQVYLAWNYPFEAASRKFVIEGYSDLFGEEGGTTVPHQSFVPRFLMDVGDIIGQPDGKLFAG